MYYYASKAPVMNEGKFVVSSFPNRLTATELDTFLIFDVKAKV